MKHEMVNLNKYRFFINSFVCIHAMSTVSKNNILCNIIYKEIEYILTFEIRKSPNQTPFQNINANFFIRCI